MASHIIGRIECAVCDFASAHVKQSEKCIFTFCPECGSQTHHRTERQQSAIKAKMRDVNAPAPQPSDTPTPTPAQEKPSDKPTPSATPAPPTPTPTRKSRVGFFD